MALPPSSVSFLDACQTIPSIAIRINLTATLFSIFDQLHEERDLIPEPDLKQLVDRYFVYLTASCQSVNLLHKRGSWLLHYGTTVKTKLLDTKRKRERHFTVDPEITDYDLLDKVTALITAASLYFQGLRSGSQSDFGISDVLDSILELVSKITPAPESSVYTQLTDRATSIAHLFSVLTQCRVEEEDVNFGIVLSLLELRYAMQHYIHAVIRTH